ncbi:acyltransferase [Novosphingobium sp. PS1R-30]|uniref:Acyltransferase n=1 Tax=Novosphingobium anseongense TaxID=3133436 RepID=A0ABU8RVH9_9SPHN
MRFNTLDGLRGFAAILVLFYHLGPFSPIRVPGGYLAVDLFFALSGFVIAHAYEQRLRDGMPLREFALLRLVRVYPMAFVGAAIGVFLSGRYFESLLLLPSFEGMAVRSPGLMPLYPGNGPMWSLALELLANLLFALVIVRLGWRGLVAVILASGAIFLAGALHHSLAELGAFWPTIGFGLARTLFSFSLGVAMHRLHVRFAVQRRETRLAWLLPVALVLVTLQVSGGQTLWNLASVFVALPLILWLATIWEAPRTRLFEQVGGLSYPLYCIHGVIVQTCNELGGSPAYLWVLLIAAAWWLNTRIDVPLRRHLLSLLDRRRAALAPA